MNRFIISALVLSAVTVNAQAKEGMVGINTDEPKATLHVVGKNPSTRAEGIVFPHATQAEINSWQGIGGLEIGTTVYNTDQRCLESWTGVKWANHCGGRQAIPPGPPVPPSNPDQILPAPVPPPTLPSLPGGLVLGDSGYYIASIYDDNYLPYTANTGTAQFGVSNPDSHDATSPSNPHPSENYVIDVQGILNHTGVEVAIPIKQYTGTTVTIPEFSVYSKVAAGLTQNNTETEVELYFPAQSFTYGGALTQRKYIKATLRAKDPAKPLLVKKLDMNIGNGANYRGVPLAEFKYFSDDNKLAQRTFYFNAVTGIPDLNFDVSQDAKSGLHTGQYLHRFIYIPAYGLDGRVWLSKNLGAAYANLDDYANFNPNKRAESTTDYKAYGSLFQWGRISAHNIGLLGHELMDWTSSTAGQIKIPALNWTSDWSSQITSHVEYCPSGFKTPSLADWRAYINALTNGTSGNGVAEVWNDLSLRLSVPGRREFYSGPTFSYVGGSGTYWSTTSNGNKTYVLYFHSSDSNLNSFTYRSYGFSIRCVKQ